ncbi:Stress response protein SCP2 [Pseudonocardia thermophila]|uniref:Stress response protein SCP2 n=2 Tax=Pseudonocardia thermophila TaxID=1848 RepID=A0A1M6R896_PSETH|nr:Stress response protein SCP2 [Pseudonocardia thermophila]
MVPATGRMRRMPDLQRGANAPLSGGPLDLAVLGARPGAVDLFVFQLGADRRVRSDADLVFFNNPASPEGAVRLAGTDRVQVDPAGVPADVARLAVAVALDAGVPGALADVPGLGVTVTDDGQRIVARAEGLTTERAAVLVEVYRRGGGWKVRSESAGWTEGLAALVREHGVTVDDAPEEPQPAAAVRTVPGEEKLSLVKRQQLDLRKKEVHRVLLTKGAAGERARILLVIDKTGSMHRQYRDGVVHRVVERMVPVAVQLDDDGVLEPYLYARSFARLPDLRVADLEWWPGQFLHLRGVHGGIDYDRIGHANDEIAIMTEVMAGLRGRRTPTLVLFFTDGGFSRKREIAELMTEAAHLPAFWQFVGIGKANYGLLESLDELPGRVVDNAGFFALDDVDSVSDAELYQRLLSEFPDWLRAARAAGIVGAG